MSKGLGHVGRTIRAVFTAQPDHAFTVDELCRRVYPGINRVEKKHRVAVLRAAFKLPELLSIYNHSKTLIFFVLDDVRSYGMARLKPSSYSDEQILARLQPGGDHHDRVVEGGAWWNHVEQYKAKRAGDFAKVQQLHAQLEAQSQAKAQRAQASLRDTTLRMHSVEYQLAVWRTLFTTSN